jgi:hypothetical protein
MLQRSLTIAGKAHWVNFKYENLPVFCFNCGRIAHGESGCPTRIHPDQRKEWGVWLRAEKPRKQGLSSGAGQMPSGFLQGRFSSNTSGGGRIQTEMQESVIGGNPKPNQHSHKVSTATQSKSIQYLPKTDVNEAIVGNNGFKGLTGTAGSAGVSQGKENQNNDRGKSAQLGLMRDSGQLKWVQKDVTGLLNIGPNPEYKPDGDIRAHNVKMTDGPVSTNLSDVEKKHGFFIEGKLTGGLAGEVVAQGAIQVVSDVTKSVEEGSKSRCLLSQKVNATSQKLTGQYVLGVDHGNETGEKVEKKTERQTGEYLIKTVTEMEKKSDGDEEKQNYQEQNKNYSKVWQRAVRNEEKEIVPDGPHHTQLGKRKGF